MTLRIMTLFALALCLPGTAMAVSSASDLVQVAQTDEQSPKPKPAEEEDELGEDDC